MAVQDLPVVTALVWSPMLWALGIREKGLLSELGKTQEWQHLGWV